jgi:hypothetical protein
LIANELILSKQLGQQNSEELEQQQVKNKSEFEFFDVIEEEYLDEECIYIEPIVEKRVETPRTSLVPERKRPKKIDSIKSAPKRSPRVVVHSALKVSQAFKDEIEKMPTDENGKVTCPDCLKTMKKRAYAEHYERSHLGVKYFMCDLCGKDFYKIWDLRAHMGSHMKVPPVKCPRCSKSLKTQAHLRRHLIYDHDIAQEFVCEICALKFKENHKLQHHIRLKHNDSFRFQCPYNGCESQYKSESNLKQHINNIHEATDETCDVCHKVFKSKFRLYNHKRIQVRNFVNFVAQFIN